VLAGAYVTERIMPGAVGIDHGAKYDPIVPGRSTGAGDQHHVPRNCTSKNTVAWRLRLSGGVEKADSNLAAKHPTPFERECDVAAGPCVAGSKRRARRLSG